MTAIDKNQAEPEPAGAAPAGGAPIGAEPAGGAPAAHTPIDVKHLGEFNQRIGLELIETRPERVVGTLPVEGNRQPYGLLHGGANASLAETLGSLAAALNAPGRMVVGLELSCTHHRAARSGRITGVCTPVHVGRTTSTFETVITDESGRRTCTARLTCVTIGDDPNTKA